jgi:hypothetical protein
VDSQAKYNLQSFQEDPQDIQSEESTKFSDYFYSTMMMEVHSHSNHVLNPNPNDQWKKM